MIGQCRDAGLGQRLGGALDLGTRQAIDDAGVAGVTFPDEGFELRLRVLLVDDLISDVRSIEACHELRRVGEPEAADDFLSRQFIGGRGQRDAGNIRKTLGDRRKADIFRAEIVAPLRHAMRFVDREQRDLGAREQRQAARRQQPFRRDIEQIEIARNEPLFDAVGFVEAQRGIQRCGPDAGFGQARDLVTHQRNQR